MFENQITYTIIMTFKDSAGSIRSIKVPNARANVTGREVRKVMEQIVRDGVFLSRNGLPLVKLVRAVLVKVRWIFVAAKAVPKKDAKAAAPESSASAQLENPPASPVDSGAAPREPVTALPRAEENTALPPSGKFPHNILYFPLQRKGSRTAACSRIRKYKAA